jgi:hypothetical protein
LIENAGWDFPSAYGVSSGATQSFKRKEQRARDGAKATAEYEAAGVALRKKTARLKALRLAKEGAELEAQVKTEHVTSGS